MNNIVNTELFELLNIEWTLDYFFDTELSTSFVSEDTPNKEDIPPFELDAEGIPIGNTKEAYKARQDIINKFWHQLKEKYKTPEEFKIYNNHLKEYIYLRAISLIEAKEHSAKNNLSTRAFLLLEDVLADARPVGRVKVKQDDSNQKAFQQMLIMTHHCDGIGRVKLTIGVKKKKGEEQKIEYSLTHLPDGSPLIPPHKKKKRSCQK